MSAASRRALLALLALLLSTTAIAQGFPEFGDEIYRPRLRQDGKDVMWLPTPDALVLRMLGAANTTADDIVVDLGAGDGRIPIAAARQFGARAIGVEYDRDLAALATRNAAREGVADRVTIVAGDLFKYDFRHATVVTLYLLPDINQQLRPQLLAMRPGTRIVSHRWDMGEWEPDATLRAGDSEAYLWVVPAAVAGRWTLSADDGSFTAEVELTQTYQRIGGAMRSPKLEQTLVGAYVAGATLGFTFTGSDGGVRTIRARVDGESLTGTLSFVGQPTAMRGRRSANKTAAPAR